MRGLGNVVGVGVLSMLVGVAGVPVALAVDREVYDDPAAPQPGKTLRGKILKVDEREGPQRWDVAVQNGETGEVVTLHLDKTTYRRDMQLAPMIGNNVIVKYDEQSKHAISFLTDARLSR